MYQVGFGGEVQIRSCLSRILEERGLKKSSKQTPASLVAQLVKNLPAMQETWVRSLAWEEPLEEGMATHSSILAWRIPMDRGAWRATAHGVAKSQTQLSNKAQEQ